MGQWERKPTIWYEGGENPDRGGLCSKWSCSLGVREGRVLALGREENSLRLVVAMKACRRVWKLGSCVDGIWMVCGWSGAVLTAKGQFQWRNGGRVGCL